MTGHTGRTRQAKTAREQGKKLRNQRYQTETHTSQAKTENTSTYAPESQRESGSERRGKGVA